MKKNTVWLLVAALVLLPLVSLQAQAGDRCCERSCTEMAGCCGADGSCDYDGGCDGNRCVHKKHVCCSECREACRLDSTYECRCHGDGCVLEGCAKECRQRFRGSEGRDYGHRDCGKGRGKRMGHRGAMGPMGLMAPEFQQRMKLQGRIDGELQLCGCQEKRLSHIYEANNKIERGLMHRYFTDRRVDIDQLNWQLTQLHHKVDWHARGQLNPLQNAVFPEHEWFNYCLGNWDEGFHPGVDYVIGELDGRGRKHHRKMKPCCPSEG